MAVSRESGMTTTAGWGGGLDGPVEGTELGVGMGGGSEGGDEELGGRPGGVSLKKASLTEVVFPVDGKEMWPLTRAARWRSGLCRSPLWLMYTTNPGTRREEVGDDIVAGRPRESG